jgi:hypothetical protein
MYMVGRRPDDREVVSVLIVGDSRNYGASDFTTGIPAGMERAPLASIERGLDDLSTGRVPSGSVSVPGSGVSQSYNGVFNGINYAPGMTHRFAPLLALKSLYDGQLPFNEIVDGHTGNGNPSFATMRDAHVTTLRAVFPGIRLHKFTLPPRVGHNTPDAYKTLAGQNPIGYDLYPSGGKAALNAELMATVGTLYDTVFDYGKVESAAHSLNTGDANFDEYRSKFRTAPRSAFIAVNYTGAGEIVLKSALQIGDSIAVNDEKHAGPIRLIVNNGNGTWTHTLQVGSNPSHVYIPVDETVVVVPTKDGTHPEPWLHIVGAQAVAEWKRFTLLR